MARKRSRFWHPARRVLRQAAEAARGRMAQRKMVPMLDDVRPRLQHYIRAMYGHSVVIESLAPPRQARWTTRALHQLALMKERATSESSAERIGLPIKLPAHDTDIAPIEQYRLIAVQHAERMRRATARHARDVTSDLERDLYELAESASIDAQIMENQPGLKAALDAARLHAMTQRPKPRWRTAIELSVEEMVQRAWHGRNVADADANLPTLPLDNDAESNATWARRTAMVLEVKHGRKAAREYRRVPEMTLWQTTIRSLLPDEQQFALETETRQVESKAPPTSRSGKSRSSRDGPPEAQSSDTKEGNSPGSSESNDASARAEANRTDGRANDGQGAPEPSPEVNTEPTTGEQSAGSTPSSGGAGPEGRQGIGHSDQEIQDAQIAEGVTYWYPEWDCYAKGFRPTGTTVRVMPPTLASSEWATATVQAHAREVHRAKRQFERLRSERLRLKRQVQGGELDLEACVEAMVDRRMHVAPSDRLYSHVRPGRRELAIILLIDVSGSTSHDAAEKHRIIDVERIAALVATAAFDALGDDYSILAFSSAGASNVRVHTIKDFGERNSPLVRQRISALAPHGTTRLGAAVRHATAGLMNHPAPHRLLLILSDGKPYDYDWYFVDYAIQDSRHAVLNARLQGIHPFCITIDASSGEKYLEDIFGATGYRVVSRPSQLSQALLLAVQRMIGST